MIEVKNLVKRYGDHYAVDHLSFTVEDGQIFGFLGPNGAGEIHHHDMMTGYLAATEGQVLVEGHDILEEREAARENIGYLPELRAPVSGYDGDGVSALLRGAEEGPQGAAGGAAPAGADPDPSEDMSSRLIRNLSKGYRQRGGPGPGHPGLSKIIILDEPPWAWTPSRWWRSGI